ncbi:general transcription factor IIF subunit 2 [Trichonephila clavipes]|nr:general transcription factor IIF subunit 2 [Trichonephila clavipes]
MLNLLWLKVLLGWCGSLDSGVAAEIEYEQKKKAEGRKARDDKDKVMDMLFAAFEKHQYYNIKDLEKITKQPVPYLKEILKEICNYNAKNPHKSTWELKPEYRHYKGSDDTKE